MGRIQARAKATAPRVRGDSAAVPETPSTSAITFIEPERRRVMISEAAYFIAAKREFRPGRELDDWLQAESEIDSTLTAAMPGARRRPVTDGSGEG